MMLLSTNRSRSQLSLFRGSGVVIRMSNKVVVVTGFGPFRGHEEVNPSWEAVRLLPDELEFNGIVYPIRKFEIPVLYEQVEQAEKDIWALDPLLVIHCGVNGRINCINLESNARNGEFCDEDFAGQRLACTTAPLCNNGTECRMLETRLDVDRMAKELNATVAEGKGGVFCRSDDVGNYLCCYIYLNSLDKCTARSLFIHVPPLSGQFTRAFLSNCVQQVILKSLEQRLEQLSGQ